MPASLGGALVIFSHPDNGSRQHVAKAEDPLQALHQKDAIAASITPDGPGRPNRPAQE